MEIVIHGVDDLPDVTLSECVDIGGTKGYNITLKQAAMRQWPEHDSYHLSVSWDTKFSQLYERDVITYWRRRRILACVVL